MYPGDYVRNTWVNGGPPAIDEDNLNNIEGKMVELDENLRRKLGFNFDTYKKYVLERSIKTVEDFEDYTSWSTLGTSTLSQEYARRFGINRVRVEENDNVAGYLGMYKTISSLDLTTFKNNLDTSSANDLIQVAFVTTNDNSVHLNIRIRLGTDAANYYEWIISGANIAFTTNIHAAAKSSFSSTGSPDWSAITYISIEWESAISSSGTAIRFEWMDLERVESGGSVANPWVLDDGNSNWDIKLMTPTLNTITFYNTTSNKISMAVGGNSNETTDLVTKIQDDVNSFTAKLGGLNAGPNMAGGIMWYQDANNYIQFIVSDFFDYIKIKAVQVGVTTEVVYYTLWSIGFKEKFKMYCEKDGSVVRLIVKRGSYDVSVTYETIITGAGDVYLSSDYHNSSGWIGGHLVEELIVSNTDLISPEDFDWTNPVILMKHRDQDATSDTSVGDDDELRIRLPPNTVFKVDAYITVSSSSNTPDFKMDWNVNDNELLYDKRWVNGPAVSSADLTNSNMQIGRYAAASDVSYGCVSGIASSIHEHFIIKSGNINDDNRLEMRWSQDTSSGTATTVERGSHLVITKVETAWSPVN